MVRSRLQVNERGTMRTLPTRQEMSASEMLNDTADEIGLSADSPEFIACLDAWELIRQGPDVASISALAEAGFDVGVVPHDDDKTPQFAAIKVTRDADSERAGKGFSVARLNIAMLDAPIVGDRIGVTDCNIATGAVYLKEPGQFAKMVAKAIEAMP